MRVVYSERLVITMRAHRGLDLVRFKAAILQETHLAGLFREPCRKVGAEFPVPHFSRESEPILFRVFHGLLDVCRPETPILKLLANTDGSFALVNPRLDETTGKTHIALQPLAGQPCDFGQRDIGREPGRRQFTNKFILPVFAASEKVHGFPASFLGIGKAIDLFRLEEVGVQFID